ncbi:MAG: zinc ribbon domain-containing protein [Desulfobacterales bacterium]
MPIYEYECESCGRIIEAFQNFSEKPLKKCGHCSGKLHKIISQSTFHLKGTGWYVTDYAGKKQKANIQQKNQEGASSDSGGEAKSAKTDSNSSGSKAE